MATTPQGRSRLPYLIAGAVALVLLVAGAGWLLRRGDALATLRGHRDVVRAVAFSPDGKFLASAGDDGKVRVWDSATNSLRHTLEGHAGRIAVMAFSPN